MPTESPRLRRLSATAATAPLTTCPFARKNRSATGFTNWKPVAGAYPSTLCADWTPAVEHAARTADEGLRADAVEKHAVKAAIAEETVIDAHDIGRVLRVGRAVEPEAFSGGKVVIAGDFAPQVDGGDIVANFFRFSEDRQPQQHLDAFGVQVFADGLIELGLDAPADDDFLDRNQGRDRVDAADNLFGGIIGGVPASEGDLHDIPGFRRRLGFTGCQGDEPQQHKDQFPHYRSTRVNTGSLPSSTSTCTFIERGSPKEGAPSRGLSFAMN